MKSKTSLAAIILIPGLAIAIWQVRTRTMQMELDRRLLDAAFIGDARQVALLLAAGASPNASRSGAKAARLWSDHLRHVAEAITQRRGKPGLTAVETAALTRNFGVVRVLVEAGADPNARIAAEPLLAYAIAYHADSKTIETLMCKGADVNARGHDEATALHWAAFRGDEKIVRILIDAGIHPDHRTSTGKTALMLAKASGRSETCRLLVNRAARR